MISFKHSCPHCGIENSGFEVKTYFENRKYPNFAIFSILATCNTCGGSIVGDVNISDQFEYSTPCLDKFLNKLESDIKYNLVEACEDSSVREWNIQFYPNHKPQLEIPECLPDEVNRLMRTAEKLYIQAKADEDMIESAGTAYRKTLEIALAFLDNGTDKNLNQRINQLVKDGVLVKSMGYFAHSIRVLGNEATHAEISLDELSELRLFTSLFLKYTFTLPAMIPKGLNQS